MLIWNDSVIAVKFIGILANTELSLPDRKDERLIQFIDYVISCY